MYENFFHIIPREMLVFSFSSDSMVATVDCCQNRSVDAAFLYNTYLMQLSVFCHHKILNGPKVIKNNKQKNKKLYIKYYIIIILLCSIYVALLMIIPNYIYSPK